LRSRGLGEAAAGREGKRERGSGKDRDHERECELRK
jgi:hypothetical protein